MEQKNEQNAQEVEKRNPATPPRGGARRPKTTNRYTRDFKLRAVKLFLEESFTRNAIAAELHICIGTLDRWVTQYRQLGEAGLENHATGPHPGEPKLAPAVTEKIIEVKKLNPSFGVKRISQWLRRAFFLKASAETVRQRLHEAALIDPAPKAKRRNMTRPRFFERATPNQMWQSDIFTFRLGGRYAYLIAFLDDYSRLVTAADLFRSPTAAAVIEVYRQGVGEFQPPKEMLTDNGRQYTTWRGTSRFEAELKKDRVAHFKSRPHHPMTLGKIERFWATIWQEFLERAQFESFESARERIKLWIKYYNYRRPHQGIEGLCPADRFFEIQTELRKTMESGIKENILEMALRGQPKAPFYMVGRMEGQSVVLRAEKGKLKLELSDSKNQSTQELTYELNQPQGAEGQQREEQQTPPLHSLQLQCPGESAGGAGGLDGALQRGGHLPPTEHHSDDLPPMATTSHAIDAPGAGDSGQPGQGHGAESAVAGPPAETSTRPGSGQTLPKAGADPKQSCQPPGQSATKELDEHPSAEGTGAGHTDHEGALRPTDSDGSSANTGSLAQNLLSMGTTGPGGNAGPIGGPARGPAREPERSGEGVAPETTGPGRERTAGGPASEGTAGDPGHFASNPS